MFNDINAKLKNTREELEKLSDLNSQLSSLEKKLYLGNKAVKDCLNKQSEKIKDIEKLNKHSFANLCSSIIGTKERKLSAYKNELSTLEDTLSNYRESIKGYTSEIRSIKSSIHRIKLRHKVLLEEKKCLIYEHNTCHIEDLRNHQIKMNSILSIRSKLFNDKSIYSNILEEIKLIQDKFDNVSSYSNLNSFSDEFKNIPLNHIKEHINKILQLSKNIQLDDPTLPVGSPNLSELGTLLDSTFNNMFNEYSVIEENTFIINYISELNSEILHYLNHLDFLDGELHFKLERTKYYYYKFLENVA